MIAGDVPNAMIDDRKRRHASFRARLYARNIVDVTAISHTRGWKGFLSGLLITCTHNDTLICDRERPARGMKSDARERGERLPREEESVSRA